MIDSKNVLKQYVFFKKIIIEILVGSITIYQKCISPIFPECCKYYPSCSEFAKRNLRKNGILKGSFLAFCRIIRCNPFSLGGVDLPKQFKLNMLWKKI